MRRSAISAGIASSAVSTNTARADTRRPQAPISAAAMALPSEALDDDLGLRQFVANRDEEAAGVASHALVLAKAEPNTQRTVSVGALAEVLVQLLVGIKQVRFRDLGDPLVDLPIERLVLRQSLLTRIHSTGP